MAEQAQPRIFTIPEWRMTDLVRRLEALNRRALKLGIEPLSYKVGPLYEKKFQVAYDHVEDKPTYQFFQVQDIAFEKHILKYKGWSFLAHIEFTEAGNIILANRFDIPIPTSYRTSGLICEHCKTDRFRKYGYLLYHEEEKRIVQVGKQCLRYYLGRDAELLAVAAQYFNDLIRAGEYEGGVWMGREVITCGLARFTEQCAALILKYGYVSFKKAREEDETRTATAADAWFLTGPPPFKGWSDREKADRVITPEAEELADKALWWMNGRCSMDSTEDYLYNMAVLFERGYTTHKTIALMASIVPSYLREQLKDQERKAFVESKHFGDIGKREIIRVKILGKYYTDSDFGATTIYKMVTPDGNLATWFQKSGEPLEVGATYEGKATIKRHSEYKGKKETIVNRCKFELVKEEVAE